MSSMKQCFANDKFWYIAQWRPQPSSSAARLSWQASIPQLLIMLNTPTCLNKT